MNQLERVGETTIARGNLQVCQDKHHNGLAGKGRTGIEIIAVFMDKKSGKAFKTYWLWAQGV